MSAKTVEQMIDQLIGREGNYSNQPNDKGGPTMWGVTERVARANGYTGDMRQLPRDRAAQIYRRQYWIDPHFDLVAEIFPAVAEGMFDIGVNMGSVHAGTFLQRILNACNGRQSLWSDMKVDGLVGRVTIAALRSFRQRRGEEGGEVLCFAISGLRVGRYTEITEAREANEDFYYGWLRRAMEMAA